MSRSLKTAALTLIAAASLLITRSAGAAEPVEAAAPHTWRFGTELDVLPYTTGGYYGSLFAARKAWRIRGVAARSAVPGFMVADGFKDKRTDAYAALVDRFLGGKRERREGFWIGGGAELWRNRIRREGVSEYAHYDNAVLTAGAGYVWKFSRHFYLNPWAAAHLVVAGDRNTGVSGKLYTQPRFTPETSVKVGFTF